MTCPIPPSDLGTLAMWAILPLIGVTLIAIGIYYEAKNPNREFLEKITEICVGVLMIGVLIGTSLQLFFGVGC